MKPILSTILVAGLGLGFAAATPALAHHSFAMFDRTREITVTGTVKEWQFTNPHAYLQVTAPQGGKLTEWSLETGSVSGLLRKGYRRTTYKSGDKVSVVIHPLRNGSPGGELVEVKSADGVVRGFYARLPASAQAAPPARNR